MQLSYNYQYNLINQEMSFYLLYFLYLKKKKMLKRVYNYYRHLTIIISIIDINITKFDYKINVTIILCPVNKKIKEATSTAVPLIHDNII